MLTKPLSSITNQLSSIRTKDDNSQLRIHPQPDHTDDEIGLLISTTNQQLSEIETNFHELKLAEKDRQRYTERLEQAVESRTRELTEANSELTSANQRLEFAKKEAEKSNKSRAKFLANMSHEIRTPLSGVLGMINLALDAQSGLDENIREQLELANTSGETLQQILNDILDISKVESGKINLEEVSFDLRESLEHIALLFKNSELATNVDIILDIAPDFPAEITGDPTRIKQIINNLVSNALKFTDQGYVIIEAVYLNFSESDSPFHSKHNIEIRIRDTGIGMSAAEKDRIFIPFTQANKQTTRRYGGTGLGLTLVKQLTECMNGTITVDSEEGLGSCFTLFFDFDIQSADHERFLTGLPSLNVLIDETDSNTESLNVELEILKKQINFWGGKLSLNSSRLSDHQHAYPTDQHYLTYDTTIADKLPQHKTIVIDSEDKESPYRQLTRPILAKPLKEALTAIYHLNSDNSQVDSTATAKKSDADHKYNHESILIVEDNVVNQKVATGLLKKLGFTDIEIAENGKIAIDLLNNKHFDLILMDCHMPVMDGYEATKAIRKNPNTQNIPIIAVTANILNEDKEKCFDSGMNDFLTKPYRKEDLSNKLDQWLL